MHPVVRLLVCAGVLLALFSGGDAQPARKKVPDVADIKHKPPASRGRNLLCTASYPNERGQPFQQYLIETQKIKDNYQRRKAYFNCFSGGASNHRQEMLVVPFGADRSMDWGVIIKTKKNATSTTLRLINTRNEKIWVKIDVYGKDVNMSPASPIERIAGPREVSDLITVTMKPNATEPSMNWYWRAEPVVFYQRPSEKTISSNGVTLLVEQKRNHTVFSVFNDRKDHDTPVYLWLDVNPLPGVRRSNIALSRRRPMRIRVNPRRKKVFLRVWPRDITRPWLYYFNYKWQVGASPKDIFAVR